MGRGGGEGSEETGMRKESGRKVERGGEGEGSEERGRKSHLKRGKDTYVTKNTFLVIK